MTGGNIYNHMVIDVLKKRGCDIVKRKAYTPYRGKGFTYVNAIYTYFFKKSKTTDIDIMDFRAATWCSARHKGKRIVILFHFDLEETGKKRKHQFFFNRFLKNADGSRVIVISRHWKKYLEELNIKDIDVIYCAYDIPRYKAYLPEAELLKKFGLPDKPVIYIGKNSISKTWNAYNIVKPLETEYTIVTTGPVKEFDGPVHLDLNFEDYCSLLHASRVTLLLPRFSEGWSRIAHESLICGAPVIGNGSGGMGELLEKTHQYVMNEDDPEGIRALIKKIATSGKRVNEEDVRYAKTFDLEYFGRKWEEVLKELTSEKIK
jgi:glycosyltransferase involved in cell wall biosynthesis